jgi:uncharacterized protein YndB with AHSA1/START domain
LIDDRIERDVVIDAPIEVVWAVVTEPEHMGAWFSDTVAIDLRPGGEVLLHWEGHGTVRGRVERVERPRLFAFHWTVGSGETLVEFTLTAEGAGTRLTVVESGFSSLAMPEDEQRHHFDGHSSGWESELGDLEEYMSR